MTRYSKILMASMCFVTLGCVDPNTSPGAFQIPQNQTRNLRREKPLSFGDKACQEVTAQALTAIATKNLNHIDHQGELKITVQKTGQMKTMTFRKMKLIHTVLESEITAEKIANNDGSAKALTSIFLETSRCQPVGVSSNLLTESPDSKSPCDYTAQIKKLVEESMTAGTRLKSLRVGLRKGYNLSGFWHQTLFPSLNREKIFDIYAVWESSTGSSTETSNGGVSEGPSPNSTEASETQTTKVGLFLTETLDSPQCHVRMVDQANLKPVP